MSRGRGFSFFNTTTECHVELQKERKITDPHKYLFVPYTRCHAYLGQQPRTLWAK